MLVVVQASCSGVLISSRSHSDKPFVSDEGFVDIDVPRERIFLQLLLFQTMAFTHRDRNGSQMDYLFCVCFLTPLSLRSIFRCRKEAFHYCAFDKVAGELCSLQRAGPL